jgi:hypothetical protein
VGGGPQNWSGRVGEEKNPCPCPELNLSRPARSVVNMDVLQPLPDPTENNVFWLRQTYRDTNQVRLTFNPHPPQGEPLFILRAVIF